MGIKKRIYQIDLFRFIAAVGVMFYHYTALYRIQQPDGSYLRPFPQVAEFTKFGYLGVDLFFIISGFVIILTVQKSSLIHFIKSRITRLYPAYWFCLSLTFLVILIWGGMKYHVTFKQFLINSTMLNGFTKVPYVDGVYWSLYVELKFYFLMAIFLLINTIKKISINYFIIFWLILSIAFPFLEDVSSPVVRILKSGFILDYSPLFIAGILYFKIYKEGFKLIYLPALLICLALSIYHGINKMQDVEALYGLSYSPYSIALLLLFFNVLMFLVSNQKLQAINSPKLLRLGVMTYPLYLIHQKIGYIIFMHFMNENNRGIVIIATMILMLTSAYLINVFIEIPLSRRVSAGLDSIHRWLGQLRSKTQFAKKH